LVSDQESNVRARLYRAEAMAMDEDHPRAKRAIERAVAIHRARGETRDLAGCLLSLSFIGNSLTDFELVIRAGSEAVALAREIGDLRTEGAAHGNMAVAHLIRDNLAGAEADLQQSNALLTQVGDAHSVVGNNALLAIIARARGDLPQAARLHGEAAAGFAEIGDPVAEAVERANQAMVRSLLGDWREAAPALLRALALGQAADDAPVMLTSVSIGASVLHAAGQASGAALLWAMSGAIAESRQMRIDPLDRDETAFAKVREELGAEYAEIEAEAAGTSLDHAVHEVASRLRQLLEEDQHT
jgi:tetratricopeptide (TPR) repeat protein